MQCCVTNPAALQLIVILGIVGNAQRATATARRGMSPSVLLVVSPSLSTHRETVLTDAQPDQLKKREEKR